MALFAGDGVDLLILRNPFGIAVTVVGVFYLLVCLWAVDRGMALFGFFKFLPFPLFLIYLEQAEVDRQKLIRLLPPRLLTRLPRPQKIPR